RAGLSDVIAVEGAVAGFQVEVPAIEGQRAAGLPDTPGETVGGVIEDSFEVERGGVEASDPAVVGAVIAVGGPGDVDGAVDQRQGGPLVLAQGVKVDVALAIVVAARAIDKDRGGIRDIHPDGVADQEGGDLVGTVGQVDGVQPLDVVSDAADDLLGLGDQGEIVAGRVKDRRAGDADLDRDVGVVHVVRGDGSDARGPGQATIEKAILPQDDAMAILVADVGVDGVQAVVLGGNEDRIMNTLVGAGG